jgi:hypothetical protein
MEISMTQNLPIAPSNPAEAINISPEALEVANSYLEFQDIAKVADRLGIGTDKVSIILGRREVKAYIDHVFMDFGYNNRFKMRGIMDTIIEKKLEELQESDTGSSKDITEILALSHKMAMDLLDRQIKLEQIRHTNQIKNQTNVQINSVPAEGTNYSNLLSKLRDNNK